MMIELLMVVVGGVGKLLLLLLLISGVTFNFRVYHEQLWRDGRGKDRIIFHENGIQWGSRVAKRRIARVVERIQDTRINFFTRKVHLQHATIIIVIIEMAIIIHIGAWSTNGSGDR